MRTIFYILVILTPFLCYVVDHRQSCKTPCIKKHSEKYYFAQPSGKFSVGFIDIMTLGKPEDSVLMRIHYPTDQNYLMWHKKWPKWIPDGMYISGFYTFLQSIVKHWPSWLPKDDFLLSEVLHPLFQFLPEKGFYNIFQQLFGELHVPIIENASLAAKQNNESWPIIVFSHGIGQSRFLYSKLCSDLASHGFIVASTEHRDRSGCMSKYAINKTKITWISFLTIENDVDEYKIRNNQIHLRSVELSKTLDILTSINTGNYIHLFEDQPSHSKKAFVLKQFKESMKIEHPFIAGQSFGGSSVILTLLNDDRFKAGVSMDPWMYPVKTENILQNVSKPLLFINSESFQYSRNQEKVLEFKNSSNNSQMIGYFINGSVHQTIIDYAFLFDSNILKRVMGLHSMTCPQEVLELNNNLTINFFNDKLGRLNNNPINSDTLIEDRRFQMTM